MRYSPVREQGRSGRPGHRLVDLPNIGDERGRLLVAQAQAQVPFDIRRLFVLHGMPENAARGGHAHREQHQFLIMLEGQCEIVVDDGVMRDRVLLCRPSQALYVPPMRWLDLSEFSARAVCAVLASGDYDEADYIRDRSEFDSLSRA